MIANEQRSIRVGICQINALVGDLEFNASLIVESAKNAWDAGSDIVVFPELALCGYPPEDLLLKPTFIGACHHYLLEIARETEEMALVIGFPEGGSRLFNSAAVTFGGQIVTTYRKRILPNYAVFDEQRYFAEGFGNIDLIEINGISLGISICEDIWSPIGPALDEARGGADVILNLNASPYSVGRRYERATMLRTRASDISTPIVYVNLVGGQDELVFDGGSMVVDSDGSIVDELGLFEPQVSVVELNLSSKLRKFQLDPRGITDGQPLKRIPIVPRRFSGVDVPWPIERKIARRFEFLFHPSPRFDLNWVDQLDDYYLDEVLLALRLGLFDYVKKNSFNKVVIGISGGVDSALCAAVCTLALGSDQVVGIALPSRYSSPSSLSDAQELARNLGIQLLKVPIEPMHSAFTDVLTASLDLDVVGLTDENLQSRIRGVIMMAYSNATGALVITTGNKSEVATGFTTLYGDSVGGFALIKDLPKLLVYRLCHRINEVTFDSTAIPQSILEKAPSAELRPDQRDDESLPPYEELDPILMAIVERDMTANELWRLGFDKETAYRVSDLVDRSEYKRRQSAPGVRITPKSFGKDRRMPITNGFRVRSEDY